MCGMCGELRFDATSADLGGILQSNACIRRVFYQRAYVDKLLADPAPDDGTLTATIAHA